MPSISPAARALRSLFVPFVAVAGLNLASCGSDGGVSAFLPPGPPTQEPPGNLVVYAAMAVGGRIDAFRLGTDGLLPSQPFDSISVVNPRRLAIADGVLYATLIDRVISIRLGPDGSLPNAPTGQSDSRGDYDPVDLEVRDGILYVAAAGLGVMQSFDLEDDGDVPFEPTSNGIGEFGTDFLSIELNGQFLYSGARDTQNIEVFLLEPNGHVPPLAEAQEPDDNIALPDDIEIRDGILYVTSASDRCIRAYTIQPTGFLLDEEDSRTASEEYYSDFTLAGDMIYALAYNAGRIDLYSVNPDGQLPEEKPFYSTQDDPSSYPSRMDFHAGILYVAQAGHDRIDAYVLGVDGLPPQYPSSSTSPALGESYPLDVIVHELD